jgi:hypothetical protein
VIPAASAPVDDAGARRATAWLWWLGIAGSLLVLALSWHLPLLEAHSFRQTQTAISSYWMAEGGPWLAYQTPVLGAPWSIPFEFPLFQALALGLANLLPITLDQAGRLLSCLFGIASAWPVRHAVRAITGRERLANVAAGLLLLSPLMLFWSRAYMIETTAVFFSAAFLALVVEAWRAPRGWVIAALAAAAVAAALVKITTFVGFGIAAGLFVAASWWRETQAGGTPAALRGLRVALPLALVVAGTLALTLLWIGFGDAHKSQTLWGHLLTSDNLRTWNYGNWQQKTDPALWRGVAFGRAAREILGQAWLLPLLVAVVAIFGRGLRWFAGALLLCYLLPFFVFANLHQVHNYYQVANAPFLLVFAACAVESLWQRGGPRLAIVAALCIVLVMAGGFRRDFLPLLDASRLSLRTPALAAFARANTAPDEVLLGFGLEWSSEVPYYATRRAMLVIDATPVAALRRMQQDPASYTGTHRLGLVIACANALSTRPDAAADYAALLAAATAGRTRHRVAGCDVFR